LNYLSRAGLIYQQASILEYFTAEKFESPKVFYLLCREFGKKLEKVLRYQVANNTYEELGPLLGTLNEFEKYRREAFFADSFDRQQILAEKEQQSRNPPQDGLLVEYRKSPEARQARLREEAQETLLNDLYADYSFRFEAAELLELLEPEPLKGHHAFHRQYKLLKANGFDDRRESEESQSTPIIRESESETTVAEAEHSADNPNEIMATQTQVSIPLPVLPEGWSAEKDFKAIGSLSTATQRSIEPVGPHFLAHARRARHKRTFSEDDRIQAQENVKKVEDDDSGEISEPEDPMMLSRDPKDWKVCCIFYYIRNCTNIQ